MPRRSASDKVLHDKAFKIVKNQKFDRYQRGIFLMTYKVFDKKSYRGAVTRADIAATKSKIILNRKLTEALRKPTIKKFKNVKYTLLLKTIFGLLIVLDGN